MKQVLLIAFLSCAALQAQPGICWTAQGAAGASIGCPQTGSPTIQQYVSQYNTFLNNTWPTIDALPRPAITSDLELVGSSANWIENCPTSGTCVYNSVSTQQAFISNIIEKSGATGVVINFDYMPYMLSSEYTTATGFSCAATYAMATCTRLATNLAFYDAIMPWIVSQGLTIRLAPVSFGVPGGGSPWLICGLTPSTMTVSQRLACEEPYLAAMVAHNSNLGVALHTVIVAHEPTEVDYAATGQILSVADWNTLISGLCPAIHSATGGSGVLCGSGYAHNEAAYVANVTTSVPSGMQVFGGEIYFSSFDATPSWSNQPAVYQAWAASAKTAGLQVQIDESGPPGYCTSGAGVLCNADLIFGCGWAGMQTYNANNAFWQWLFQFSSAIGATRTTVFYDQPFALLQNGSCSDNTPTTSYTWQMLSGIPTSPTQAGLQWKAASFFPPPAPQQNTIPTTTLAAALNNSSNFVYLASTAAVTGPGNPVSNGAIDQPSGYSYTVLYMDQEAMRVTTAPVSPNAAVQVERGWDGTGTQNHSAGVKVWVAPPQGFTYIGLQGACNAPSYFILPLINDWSGAIYNCVAGVWVNELAPYYRAMRAPAVQHKKSLWIRVLRHLHLIH